ncbi:MAG: DUF4912 domain-containing protein, partial [Candidatus Omnitrophica bacterium]|nr:DUF4912 domain-containing protein [Candidatus Omnitrophota bacterium]
MAVKKPKLKKSKSIERVYKNGREAIVKTVKKKPLLKKKTPRIISTVSSIVKPIVALEKKLQSTPIKINEYELPSYNNITRITLIAKDPFWLYAYWEIAESSIEDVKRQLGGNLNDTRFVVRMYDVTYKDFNGFNANHWFDTEVGRYSNNWYISLWNDNVSYCGEIGIVHVSGRFFPMARSNFVHTPRSNSSNRFEEIWMDLSREQEFSSVPATIKDNKNKTEGAKSLGVQYDAAGRFSYSSVSKRRKLYLSAADLRAYYSKFSPLLRERLFSRISKKRIYKYLYSSMSANEWRDVLYFRRLAGEKFGRKVMIGASEFAYLGGSENIQGGASEFVHP